MHLSPVDVGAAAIAQGVHTCVEEGLLAVLIPVTRTAAGATVGDHPRVDGYSVHRKRLVSPVGSSVKGRRVMNGMSGSMAGRKARGSRKASAGTRRRGSAAVQGELRHRSKWLRPLRRAGRHGRDCVRHSQRRRARRGIILLWHRRRLRRGAGGFARGAAWTPRGRCVVGALGVTGASVIYLLVTASPEAS